MSTTQPIPPGEPAGSPARGPVPRRSPAAVRAQFYGQPLIVLGIVVGCVLILAWVVVAALGNIGSPGSGSGKRGVSWTSSSNVWIGRRRLRLELRGTDAEWRAWAAEKLRATTAKAAAADAKKRAKAAPGSEPLPEPKISLMACDRRTLTADEVAALARPLGWHVTSEDGSRGIWLARDAA
ncbi:hypothetical protein ACU686_43620 [Yinghuangia aomiensis]